MNELVLRHAGLSELACQFARFIDRLNEGEDEQVATLAGLLSEAVSQGHVCLNVTQLTRSDVNLVDNKSDLIKRLKNSRVVGVAGEYKPLILTDAGLLYLYRYWLDEQHVAKAISQRCQPIVVANPDALRQDFADWYSDINGIDWQKVAVLMALTRQFSVISGGPGTGKTTIVLRLLQMLYRQHPDLKIALAAPTGKAAARLQQAVRDIGKTDLEAKTIHRLLGITADNEQGRYNRDRPLLVDVLIVDEASMIDISLMARLLQALAAKTRIVLLGDSQQLASVESGAVLANLCNKEPEFSQQFSQMLTSVTGMSLPTSEQSATLIDSIVLLQHSYRFADDSVIGQLANAVQTGNMNAVSTVLSATTWQQIVDMSSVQMHVMAAYHAYFDAASHYMDAQQCLSVFEQFRVLCALKQGPQSVVAINQMIEKALLQRGWKTQQDFYHGRPIMVTHNDYRQRLFNGDMGLILRDEHNQLRACFGTDNGIRWIDLARLPAHETAFAITIHKSQGSEFDVVAVLLPEEDSALLNRELLYTAITRAKKQVMLLCNEAILTKTVATRHQRETGLAELLMH